MMSWASQFFALRVLGQLRKHLLHSYLISSQGACIMGQGSLELSKAQETVLQHVNSKTGVHGNSKGSFKTKCGQGRLACDLDVQV